METAAEILVDLRESGLVRRAISKIRIRNFKCIKELDLELAPLTILVGPNGAGKSSILEALVLMEIAAKRQSSFLEAIRECWPELDDVKTVLYDKNEEAWLALGFDVEVDEKEAGRLAAMLDKDGEVLGRAEISHGEEEITIVGYIHLRHIMGGYGHVFLLNDKETFSFIRPPEGGKALSKPAGLMAGSGFLRASLQYNRYPIHTTPEIEHLLRERIIGHIKFVSAHRGIIAWHERPAPLTGNRYVGARGEHLLKVLTYLQVEETERWAPYALLAKEFGIEHLWAGWHPMKGAVFGKYEDPLTRTQDLKLPMLGFGSRQILTVIAQLAVSKPGDIILVEEPEMSLHPAYQAKLPVLFGLAVLEGKQVITTTHSSYFPLALPCVLRGEGYVLEGETPAGYRRYRIKLEPEDVAIYEITRGPDGSAQARRLELDERGLKEGIPSFLEVEKELLSRYMREA